MPLSPGQAAVELQLSYQNTFVMSENVESYLRERDVGRSALRPEDAAAILAFDEDAYYIDGEVGIYDGSTVEDSTVSELTEGKYYLSIGIKTQRGRTLLNLGIIENVGEFPQLRRHRRASWHCLSARPRLTRAAQVLQVWAKRRRPLPRGRSFPLRYHPADYLPSGDL